MFGLFKRTKILPWEMELLVNVLKKLPEEFQVYISHINQGLYKGVFTGLSDIPNYIGFSYHPDIYDACYHADGRNFSLQGIKVFDVVSGQYLDYTLYFAYGVINGYAISGPKKVNIDVQKIEVSHIAPKFRENTDFNRLREILTTNELKLINPDDVYIVELEDKEYFHLSEIEDGDFFGMDMEKNLYKITHDPYRIEKIEISLKDLLSTD